MNTRTIDEIQADVKQAFSVDDADLLMQYATELDALQTPLATAGANRSRGQALYLRGDFSAALTNHQDALALYEELGDRAGMASVTLSIGNVQFRTGEYLAALDHYHRALALHDGLGDLSGVALVSDNIGSVFRRKGDYAAALEYYQRALSLHEELDNRRGAATVLSNIGIVLNDTGDYPSALEYYHRALALNEEHGNRKGIAGNTGNIGTVYYRTGDYPAVLEHYYRALAIHEELKDRDNVALVTGNIGAVYMTTGDFPAALEHYDRASTLYEEDGDRSGMARILGNIGNVHAASEDYPEAMKYYRRALAICEELGERSHASIIKANLLSMHVSIGDDAEALALLDTMDLMQIAEPGVRVQCELSRASLLRRNDDLDGATMSLQRALSEALERGLRSEAARAHRGLREIALEQNNLAGYVEHNNEYTRITEEISGKDATTKLAMQARQREIDAKDREHAQHMAVLHSTLPRHIADRVARGETVNDHYDNATVIFLDIVGFTTISDSIPSGHVVHLLEQIFTTLDAVCDRHAVVKIKTIGDSYMAVSFDSVMNAAACALDMITSLDALEIVVPPEQGDVSWTKDISEIKVRIGMHSGPVTAGVIGTARMQYDVWGDTVNTASRMESTGEPGRIQVSESFAQGLRAMDEGRSEDPTEEPLGPRPYSLALRGAIEVKGKGSMTTYWLEGASA